MPQAAIVAAFGFVVFGVAVGVSGWFAQRAWAMAAAPIVLGEVMMAQGFCPLEVRPGDVVRFAPNGAVTPALCAPAQAALRPFVEATRRGVFPTETACCPIWEHLLTFRFSMEPASRAA